ncbi:MULTISPECIES: ThiF family adenylyltransferase [Pandoraea]|uniref:ThiF family adenylyltransferase n=1 Tax=Pandoraea TaxID=93217 RepID=UPI001F5C1EED|nr:MULTISPECIES: ThiF family adenylyltransferase [Pandoraea]
MAVPVAIEDAIRSIGANDAVSSVEYSVRENGEVVVSALIDTDLPSTWRAQGQSPSGVRPVEEVQFQFWPDYPQSAPRITLRSDFNSSLAHTLMHAKGERVPPCVAFGGFSELLFQGGMAWVVSQTVLWLQNAANAALAESSLGWEPTRREGIADIVRIDIAPIVADKPQWGTPTAYSVFGAWAKEGDGSWFSQAERLNGLPELKQLKKMYDHCEELPNNTLRGSAPFFVCWPSVDKDGVMAVNDMFLPDTVKTFADLQIRAAELGCDVSLGYVISNLQSVLKKARGLLAHPAFIVLPVRRPTNVVGYTTDIEFLAYRLNMPVSGHVDDWSTLPVAQTYLATPASKELLRRLSSIPEKDSNLSFGFVGCGSLGSKIAVHMARAGVTPALLADKDTFSPHNLARHVVFPQDIKTTKKKSAVLAALLDGFPETGRPVICTQDFTGINLNHGAYRRVLTNENAVLVNTTAAPAIRYFLEHAPFSPRVLEACCMNLGSIGVMTLEGAGRNPSTEDMMVAAYEELRGKGLLKSPASMAKANIGVGMGCNSVTVPMSDARISLIAAGVGQFGLSLHSSGLSDEGLVAVAQVSDDGMSVAWERKSMGPTQVVQVVDEPGWTVRVLDTAHQKITADVARHTSVETGGVIVGRVSQVSREITITDVLDAPPDSKRLAGLFVLGTEGLTLRLKDYNEHGAGVLWCLGTWHSHLAPMGPSRVDVASANQLKGTTAGAVVLLIHRPDGYSALVRSSNS